MKVGGWGFKSSGFIVSADEPPFADLGGQDDGEFYPSKQGRMSKDHLEDVLNRSLDDERGSLRINGHSKEPIPFRSLSADGDEHFSPSAADRAKAARFTRDWPNMEESRHTDAGVQILSDSPENVVPEPRLSYLFDTGGIKPVQVRLII